MCAPFPLFTEASAIEKVRLAEDAWNDRDLEGRSLMRRRIANINEHPITEVDRKFRWPSDAGATIIRGFPNLVFDTQRHRVRMSRLLHSLRTGSES